MDEERSHGHRQKSSHKSTIDCGLQTAVDRRETRIFCPKFPCHFDRKQRITLYRIKGRRPPRK